MPYGRYHRRRSRYGRVSRAQGYRSVPKASTRLIPTYTFQRAPARKLLHVNPIFVSNSTTLTATDSHSGFHLNEVAQGDAINNREQNKFINRYLYMNCQVTWNSLTVPQLVPVPARLSVVWDREPRGLAPVYTDIFDSRDVRAFQRFEYRERFQILYDKVFAFNSNWGYVGDPTTGAGIGIIQRPFKLRIPVNRVTTYRPATVSGTPSGVIANVWQGSLYLFWSSETPSSNGSLVLEFQWRVTFEDLE